MNQKIKIILWVVVGIAVVAGSGYLIWTLFFVPGPVAGPLDGNQAPDVQDIAKPTVISANRVFDYWINKNTSEIYYLEPDGQIHKISSSGEEQNTNSKALGNMSYIKSSADGSRMAVAFGYPRTPTFAIYTPAEKTWQALPEGTTAAAWHPQTAGHLAYLKDNGAASNLFTLDLATRKSQNVLRLSQKDLDLDWVTAELIYLKDRPSNEVAGSAWVYNLKTKTIRTVAREEVSLSMRWPNGASKGFKWSANSLKLIDLNGAELSTFDIKTLPSKCTLNETSAYCAAPLNQTALTANTYPDDYFKKTRRFRDDFYLIPLANLANSTQLIGIKFLSSAISGVFVDAARMELDGNRLLFINREDQRLYSLLIK